MTHPDGSPARFDVLRPQRLAAPVTVYVEQFSAHPLETDAAELYGAPDGYIDNAGHVHQERQSASDKPVYKVELRPEDGLYPLPYMAIQADGAGWDEECAFLNAPEAKARQGFFPDGSRSFEEIDRLQIGENGTGNLISAKSRDRLLSGVAAIRLYQRSTWRSPDRYWHRRDSTRAAWRRFLSVQAGAPSGLGATQCIGARDQYRSANPGERPIRWRDLDRRQSADRRDDLLAQSADRHHRTDLRQCRPASAWHDQR